MNCPECSAVFGPDGLEKSGIVANIKADLAAANKLADEACGSAIHARKALEDERARVAALEKGNEEIHTAFSSELEAERTKREQAERELAVVLKANEELNAALSKEAMDYDAALAQVERDSSTAAANLAHADEKIRELQDFIRNSRCANYGTVTDCTCQQCSDLAKLNAALAQVERLRLACNNDGCLALARSHADGIAYHLEQGQDNGQLSRAALANWLRSLAKRLLAIEQALAAQPAQAVTP